MTEDQFDAAIAFYTSPRAPVYPEIFVHRDAKGYQTAIPVERLLTVAQNELDKRKQEAVAYRALVDCWRKHSSIRAISEIVDLLEGAVR